MNVAWDYRSGAAAHEAGVWIDPAFRCGADVIGGDRLAPLLADAFEHDVTGAQVTHVDYVPGRGLRAVYRLSGGADAPLIVRVDFMAPGDAPAAFARARRRAVDPARLALIDQVGAVAWRVPEDDRLPVLAALLDPEAAAQALTRAMGMPFGDVRTRLMSYVPRRRAVIGVETGGDGGLVVKAGRMRDERVCHRRQLQLHARADRPFRLPHPLGADATLGIRVEAAVDGVGIEDLLDHADLDRLIDDVADAIAALHSSIPHPGLQRIGTHDLLAQLQTKTLPRLTVTLPDLAGRISALADRLQACVPHDDGAADVMLHGDFHPANLLIDDDGPVFIDLDNLAIGPPERDLAIFSGRLILMGLKHAARADPICAAALELPERYQRAGGTPIRRDVFDWYLAASILTRQIANAMRRLAPGLARISEQLLDIAEVRLPAQAQAGVGERTWASTRSAAMSSSSSTRDLRSSRS